MNLILILIFLRFNISYQLTIPKNLFGCPTIYDWDNISIKNIQTGKNLEFCKSKNDKIFYPPNKKFCYLQKECNKNSEKFNLNLLNAEIYGNFSFGNINNENLELIICCNNINDNEIQNSTDYIVYSTLIVYLFFL